MKFKYQDKKITGILTIVPKNVRTFDEEMSQYDSSLTRMKRLKMVMGFKEHRIVKDGVCVSDLAIYGMEYLFQHGWLTKDEVDVLLLVTQSPDYFMPPTSNIIQGKLGLGHDVLCLDINQGCAGYIVGLMQAFSLLDQVNVHKVVLINADVLSRKGSKQDRKSYPLAGDAASITIVENDAKDGTNVSGVIHMDGTRADALIIPAGGFRQPCSQETRRMEKDDDGNLRCAENLVMKGNDVFNFMQTEVPPLIDEVLSFAGQMKEEIDYFLMHQPNKFMVDKLAEAIGVSYEKMPDNIVTYFGNSSGVTIPTNICFNLKDVMRQNICNVCLAGFGVGLTWGAMVMRLGQLDFCEMIEY